jgi:hypothetical protein
MEKKEVDTCCKGVANLTIIDEEGNPEPSVLVKVFKGDTKIRIGYTNESGFISFKELCTGEYKISFSKDGYVEQQFEFALACNETKDFTKTIIKKTVDTCFTAKLKVKVMVFESEEVIVGAKADLYLGDVLKGTAYSNEEGWVVFEGLMAPATYRLVLSKDGFITDDWEFTFPECKTIQETLRLKRQ